MEQKTLVLVYINKEFEFSNMIRNVDDAYAFKHFVKKALPNVGNFDEFNTQLSKDNSIQYSLNITSETFLNSQYNFANCLRQNMTYNNINILFILVKKHEHVSYMEELLNHITITIDLINDLLFRYQSDKIQEFTSILERSNPQNILHVCKKKKTVTIFNKEKISEILKGTGTINDPYIIKD
ncbi:35723_t:CDS:1 [Gigaspora margarita]|uniref:35723_t:CDS:1 n=1 Tax=Gigaspora margarita TaxID=4874 RepID=A0ABM8VY05_GIGMA|nr:35723_t:CDS:1 [Gigaspora margarita]